MGLTLSLAGRAGYSMGWILSLLFPLAMFVWWVDEWYIGTGRTEETIRDSEAWADLRSITPAVCRWQVKRGWRVTSGCGRRWFGADGESEWKGRYGRRPVCCSRGRCWSWGDLWTDGWCRDEQGFPCVSPAD